MNKCLQCINSIHSRTPCSIYYDTMHYTEIKLYLKERDDGVRFFLNIIHLKKNKKFHRARVFSIVS